MLFRLKTVILAVALANPLGVDGRKTQAKTRSISSPTRVATPTPTTRVLTTTTKSVTTTPTLSETNVKVVTVTETVRDGSEVGVVPTTLAKVVYSAGPEPAEAGKDRAYVGYPWRPKLPVVGYDRAEYGKNNIGGWRDPPKAVEGSGGGAGGGTGGNEELTGALRDALEEVLGKSSVRKEPEDSYSPESKDMVPSTGSTSLGMEGPIGPENAAEAQLEHEAAQNALELARVSDIANGLFNRPLNYTEYYDRNWMWLRCRTKNSQIYDVGGGWVRDHGRRWLGVMKKTPRCLPINWHFVYTNGLGWGDAEVQFDWFFPWCGIEQAVRAAMDASRREGEEARRDLYVYNCEGFNEFPWSHSEANFIKSGGYKATKEANKLALAQKPPEEEEDKLKKPAKLEKNRMEFPAGWSHC